MLELLLAIAQEPAALPDGRRLADSRTCYTLNMTRDGTTRPIGVTWQRRSAEGSRGVLQEPDPLLADRRDGRSRQELQPVPQAGGAVRADTILRRADGPAGLRREADSPQGVSAGHVPGRLAALQDR